MGRNKHDHIINILSDQNIMYQWINNFHCMPRKKDIDSLFEDFNEIQTKYSENMIDILPETRDCIEYLQFNYIQSGVTTGFNYENMKIIKDRLERNQIYLDSYVSSTCLDKPSRPYPHMIEQNMLNLHIKDPKEVIKIVDFKCPSSNMMDKNDWRIIKDIDKNDEIKFVIGNKEDYRWSKEMVEKYQLNRICPILFSPVYEVMNIKELSEWILKDGINVRLQSQLHKHIFGPEATGV